MVSVQEISIRDGREFLTCIHPRTGQIIKNVATIHQSSTNATKQHSAIKGPDDTSQAALVPETANSTLGLLVFDRSGAPIFIGAISRAENESLASDTPSVNDGDAHPGTWSPYDFAWVNGSGKFIQDANGRIVLVSEAEIQLQANSSAKVRIFKDGVSEMPVVLFVPARDAMNRIIERVNANTELIGVMSKYVAVLAQAAVVAGVDPEAQADVTAIATWQSAQSSIVAIGNEIASQTLLVPDDAEMSAAERMPDGEVGGSTNSGA